MRRWGAAARSLLAVALALAVVVLGSAARATTTWLVAIGNDEGLHDEIHLAYAERDATEVASVFQKLGDVAPADAVVALGRTAPEVRALIALTQARIALAGGSDALFVVYYSGHADARGLHLAGSILPFDELKGLVNGAAAAVKVLIVDACRSGGVTHVKGVRKAAEFAISSDATLAAKGLAVITSSTATEDSHESERLRGSFFTHHLVTGLRGAADDDGDGRVALDEAYRYAYGQTLRSSGETSDLQHPTFDVDLRGRSEVILTRLREDGERQARLVLPEPGIYLVLDKSERGPVVAEASAARAGMPLVLPPRRYFVQQRADRFYREYEVDLRGRAETSLAGLPFRVVQYARLLRKGGGAPRAIHNLVVDGGAHGAIVSGQGVTPTVGLGYVLDLPWLTFGLRARLAPPMALGDRTADGLERRQLELGLGLSGQRFFDWRFASLGVGLVVEGAWLHQTFATDGLAPARDGAAFGVGGLITLDVPLGGPLALTLEGGPMGWVFDRAKVRAGEVVGREAGQSLTWALRGGLLWSF